jgi:hypothetical protein
VYDTVGRAALRIAFRYLRVRYRRQIRVGLGVGALTVVLGAAAYLSARQVPEG